MSPASVSQRVLYDGEVSEVGEDQPAYKPPSLEGGRALVLYGPLADSTA